MVGWVRLWAWTAAAVFSVVGDAQSSSTAVVAIASGPILSLHDSSGTVVQRIDLKHSIAGFAFSSDRSKLVIVSPDTEHGGALFLIDLRTGSRRKLTPSHFAFDRLDKGETEVYDSPAFSPDGRTLVFAVHGNSPGDGNDAWENSGPLAILALPTGRARVLMATNDIEGGGPCSESDPQWSPDGMWILFNCEDGAFLTDPEGKTLVKLEIGTDDAGSSAVSWVGTKCILYTQTPQKEGRFDFNNESVKLLNLKTHLSSDAGNMLFNLGDSKGGLLRASEDAIIRQNWPMLVVETKAKRWEVRLQNGLSEPQIGAAQLLTGWNPHSIPTQCK